jgi:mono/diheme cytochrome c family protein
MHVSNFFTQVSQATLPSLGRVGNELASFRGGARRQDGEPSTNPTHPSPKPLRSLVRFSALTLAAVVLLAPASLFAAEQVDYVRDVLPIFETYCMGCHTADERQGGFAMESFDDLMRGGDSGTALTPGAAGSSRMLMMATGRLEPVMPPDGAEGLNEEEVATLTAWIEQGAVGPEGDVPVKRELRVPTIARSPAASLPITAIANTSDGVRVIARYANVEVVAADGTTLSKLPAQPGKINSLRLSRDGTRVLIGSGITGLYGRAAIYDLSSGECLSEMIGHDDVVEAAIFSPDESLVATASYDHKIVLWDAESAQPLRTLSGHNGAVFSIAFSPDGAALISGSADETVKVWHVESGRRLDTMSQPEGEVFAVAVSPDGRWVLGGSADNRLRVWRLVSSTEERINPLVVSRFVDEAPLTHLKLTQDGSAVVIVAESGNIKLLSTADWKQSAVLQSLGETATDLVISHDGSHALVSLLNGRVIRRDLPRATTAAPASSVHAVVEDVFIDTGTPKVVQERELREAQKLTEQTDFQSPVLLPRGAEVSGTIGQPSEEDWFAFDAHAGELWVVETDTSGLSSKLDSVIEVRDADAVPIIRARLQALRDSYFTFRGKNSTQTNDFRLFAWEEMKLGEYLYASGEVTRLWLYPRGADSGFDVFPGTGNRWTYFGTSGTVHALGEPAYIVRPLAAGEEPLANGLPVFDIPYLNDDDPSQTRGHDSYLLFKAPQAGRYLIRLRDTRAEGGEDYRYRLRLRPANPSFSPTVTPIKADLLRGSGREVVVRVNRIDDYEGEVTFEINSLPPGVRSNFPLTVQAGQQFATGNIWVSADAPAWDGEIKPIITAYAVINGRRVERVAGEAGPLKLADRGKVTLAIYPDDGDESARPLHADSVVSVRRGETISLIVRADRQEGFQTEVSLGNETSGRNLPHGAYVDNIGLNGLLVRENESERRFFITADEITQLGRRQFFLTGNVDGGVTSEPITIEVLP